MHIAWKNKSLPSMIYECTRGHICFSKDLSICGMKGCGKKVITISSLEFEWFYKINVDGLCINRQDLHKILEDPNMPENVKRGVSKVFRI
jgi:hypothetical protein